MENTKEQNLFKKSIITPPRHSYCYMRLSCIFLYLIVVKSYYMCNFEPYPAFKKYNSMILCMYL